jgi:HEAT repeat protein
MMRKPIASCRWPSGPPGASDPTITCVHHDPNHARMRPRFLLLLAAALISLPSGQAFAANIPTAEADLIRLLRSNAGPEEKDRACLELRRTGTGASVAALASLLIEEDLSHSARLALESMPDPSADAALRTALEHTSGLTQAGILDSVGRRRDAAAVRPLTELLTDPDTTVAIAATTALGQIDSPEIPGLLYAVQRHVEDPLRLVVLDSLLQYANRAFQRGEQAVASAIFLALDQPSEQHQIRSAAYRGRIASSGDHEALALVTNALQGEDNPARIGALSLLRDLPAPETSLVLADLLPDLAPHLQVAVIEALAQRGDRAAANAILALTRSDHLPVQLVAIHAIGILGDSSAIPALLDAARSDSPQLQRAAHDSLLVLRHGPVTQTLIAQLPAASGPALAELIRALGGRADPSAVPPLLDLAAHGEPSSRSASFRALATLATRQDLPALTQRLLHEPDPTPQEEARRAIASLFRRVQWQEEPMDVDPIVQGTTDTSNPQPGRIALLQIASLLRDPQIRAALRTTTQDPEPAVRNAAIRALCDSQDPELLPDLLAVARDPATVGYRLQAIRGSVRLATEPTAQADTPAAVDWLARILEISQSPEEQRVVLSGLATQPTLSSFQLVMTLVDQPAVQPEAVQALLRIAAGIAGQHPQIVQSAMRHTLALTSEPAQRQSIESLLAQMEATADYITAWNLAGPYTEPGKDYVALFDIVFPPEDVSATHDIPWTTLPDSSSRLHPGIVDLLKSVGGDQRVAYLRTAVFSPVQQPVILELGTDDGVKAWLNGSLVHAHNVARPLTIGSDKVPANLQAGWNVLLLKITQNNLGWEFTARFVQPDGSRLADLRIDPLHSGPALNRSAGAVPR